nr:MAG TPA: hypothetical protein [Caudoviricetes sp.]
MSKLRRTALSKLLEERSVADSCIVPTPTYTSVKAIGNCVGDVYHISRRPLLTIPHWLKSNSAPTYRGNVILCRHIREAVYCYFFNGTTRPIIII